MTVVPTEKADTDSVNKSSEPMSKTIAETSETTSDDSPRETELPSESSSTLQPPKASDSVIESSSHIEEVPTASDSTESCQSTPDCANEYEQPSTSGSSSESLETEVGKGISFIQPLSTTVLESDSSSTGFEQVTAEIQSSDADCDISRTTEKTSGPEEKTSVEELQEKLKQVEQRFTGIAVTNIFPNHP